VRPRCPRDGFGRLRAPGDDHEIIATGDGMHFADEWPTSRSQCEGAGFRPRPVSCPPLPIRASGDGALLAVVRVDPPERRLRNRPRHRHGRQRVEDVVN